MNLLDQIIAANSQPAASKTDDELRKIRLQNLALGGQAQSDKAVERYRAVMEGKGWITQRQIEDALGYAATVSTTFLRKLLDKGLVERRNKGGLMGSPKRAGYEWRWKD